LAATTSGGEANIGGHEEVSGGEDIAGGGGVGGAVDGDDDSDSDDINCDDDEVSSRGGDVDRKSISIDCGKDGDNSNGGDVDAAVTIADVDVLEGHSSSDGKVFSCHVANFSRLPTEEVESWEWNVEKASKSSKSDADLCDDFWNEIGFPRGTRWWEHQDHLLRSSCPTTPQSKSNHNLFLL
jgi:hypothetical protein